MLIITKKEWLQLPYIVRLWRTLFCSHPFISSEKIGEVYDKDGDVPGYQFVVNVRRCGLCREYFIDPGLETDKSDCQRI